MDKQGKRGSEKLMAAWHARSISEASVQEIAHALDASPAKVLAAKVVGGERATGVSVALAYEGDDVPRCGNDILFWLKWHRTHGGTVRPPRILINGTPWPDFLRLELDFGDTVGPARGAAAVDVREVAEVIGKVGGGLGGG